MRILGSKANAEGPTILVDWASRRSRMHPSGRDQIRAVVTPGVHPRGVLEALALSMAGEAGSRHALVNVFTAPSALEAWDGTGGVNEADNPAWVCQVVVDKGWGRPRVSGFEPARDWDTGRPREEAIAP